MSADNAAWLIPFRKPLALGQTLAFQSTVEVVRRRLGAMCYAGVGGKGLFSSICFLLLVVLGE